MDDSRGTHTDTLTTAALVFLSYLAAADLGHALFAVTAPTLLSPAIGIALAAAFFGGGETIIAIFLAEFVFAFFVAASSLFAALALGFASALATAFGARILKGFSFHSGISRLRDAYLLIGVVIVESAIPPTIGVTLAAAGILPVASLAMRWGSWYLGNLLSLLVLTPFLLRWLPKLSFERSRREWIELGLALGSVVLVSSLGFATPYGVIVGVPLIYLLLLPLLWIALRLGPRIMTLALALLALVAVVGTIARAPAATLAVTLFSVELLVIVLAITFLVLVAIAEERKDATNTLHKQLLRLEEALDKIRNEDRAKNDFIALLAHELRNPLAPLLSSLELLRLTETDAATKNTVNSMRGRVRTMGRLLDDLLDLSRIEHRTLSVALERVDAGVMIRRAVETTEPLLRNSGHQLTLALPEEPIEITADPVRIEQVIVNLLTNANKYSAAGGTISVTLEKDRERAVIRVKDTGVGIAHEMLRRIFEPFRQGEPGRRAGGLGIGLTLSKNLVEMHDGTLEVESAGVGQGSEFIVRLPFAKRSAAKLPRTERERELKKLKRTSPLSLLIVDDNRAAADSLGALLAHVGHKPEIAYDGATGLAKAARREHSAIILDIGLPDISGYEVARRLREGGVASTLIALTGFGQADDKEKARAAGFAYHVTKPVGLVDMEKILREIAEAT